MFKKAYYWHIIETDGEIWRSAEAKRTHKWPFLPILTSVHEVATLSRNYLESRKVFFDRGSPCFKIKHCLTLHATA